LTILASFLRYDGTLKIKLDYVTWLRLFQGRFVICM